MRLLVREDEDPDRIEFVAELKNAHDVTGVHLHLKGNSSDGLYGKSLECTLLV